MSQLPWIVLKTVFKTRELLIMCGNERTQQCLNCCFQPQGRQIGFFWVRSRSQVSRIALSKSKGAFNLIYSQEFIVYFLQQRTVFRSAFLISSTRFLFLSLEKVNRCFIPNYMDFMAFLVNSKKIPQSCTVMRQSELQNLLIDQIYLNWFIRVD